MSSGCRLNSENDNVFVVKSIYSCRVCPKGLLFGCLPEACWKCGAAFRWHRESKNDRSSGSLPETRSRTTTGLPEVFRGCLPEEILRIFWPCTSKVSSNVGFVHWLRQHQFQLAFKVHLKSLARYSGDLPQVFRRSCGGLSGVFRGGYSSLAGSLSPSRFSGIEGQVSPPIRYYQATQ